MLKKGCFSASFFCRFSSPRRRPDDSSRKRGCINARDTARVKPFSRGREERKKRRKRRKRRRKEVARSGQGTKRKRREKRGRAKEREKETSTRDPNANFIELRRYAVEVQSELRGRVASRDADCSETAVFYVRFFEGAPRRSAKPLLPFRKVRASLALTRVLRGRGGLARPPEKR